MKINLNCEELTDLLKRVRFIAKDYKVIHIARSSASDTNSPSINIIIKKVIK